MKINSEIIDYLSYSSQQAGQLKTFHQKMSQYRRSLVLCYILTLNLKHPVLPSVKKVQTSLVLRRGLGNIYDPPTSHHVQQPKATMRSGENSVQMKRKQAGTELCQAQSRSLKF